MSLSYGRSIKSEPSHATAQRSTDVTQNFEADKSRVRRRQYHGFLVDDVVGNALLYAVPKLSF